jgi:hypothetical protein
MVTAATMIDMSQGHLPTQDEAKWQLDFLGAGRRSSTSSTAKMPSSWTVIRCCTPKDGSPRSNPGDPIPPSSIRSARIGSLRYPHRGRKEKLMEIRGKVIEQIV